jgi:hypothetical protein
LHITSLPPGDKKGEDIRLDIKDIASFVIISSSVRHDDRMLDALAKGTEVTKQEHKKAPAEGQLRKAGLS